MAGSRSRPKLASILVVALIPAATWLCLSATPAFANGGIDPTFSADGRVVTDLDAGSDDEALAVAIDAQGRLVLAGYSFKSPDGIRLAVVGAINDHHLLALPLENGDAPTPEATIAPERKCCAFPNLGRRGDDEFPNRRRMDYRSPTHQPP